MTAKFIVFEGPDGSGTTRQTAFLVDSLRKSGKSVLMTAEPTESKVGQDIRKMLQQDTMPTPDSMQLLFCADRANHVSTVIEPALRKGQIVVCDRFSLSTIVYGAAQGIDKQWLESINAKFPKPDLTFITLPPFDICMERINRRKTQDQFEMENFQRRVYENYKSIEDPSVVFVDTSGSKQETADFVWRQYQERFAERSKTENLKI
ncbi:MAG: dTMP kinase [bacterium]|nr:dTMP kinase [bacterium]